MLFLLSEIGNSSFNITKSDSLIQPESADDRQGKSVVNIRSCTSSRQDGNSKCTVDN